jgi:hypothetical protein
MDRAHDPAEPPEAVNQAHRSPQVGPAGQARPGGTRKAILALLLGWSFIAWIWLSRPEFIFGPGEEQQSELVRDASLRFAMYLHHTSLAAYAEEHGGRLPATLADVDAADDDVRYQQHGDGYTLTATVGDWTLLLTDKMDADSFLGDALTVLRDQP